MTTIVVMAKTAVPGRVKTRLCPPFTPAQAAELAQAALLDTLDVVLTAPAARRILALEGPPGSWVPTGYEVHAQRGTTLDERIANAIAPISTPVLVIGMDTPQLTVDHLTVPWTEHDAWFGAADDGGFWALGLREPDPALVRGVAMSRADTGAVQRARLEAAALTVGLLPSLRDVDTAEDAELVAASAPGSRFAAQYRQVAAALEVSHVG